MEACGFIALGPRPALTKVLQDFHYHHKTFFSLLLLKRVSWEKSSLAKAVWADIDRISDTDALRMVGAY